MFPNTISESRLILEIYLVFGDMYRYSIHNFSMIHEKQKKNLLSHAILQMNI